MPPFWDRRRAAVAKEEARLEVEAHDARLAERTDEDILAELDLPAPEALETPDAVREFLRAELPQRLKTRALRKLWRMNPVLANLDGLIDYGDDYTDSATVVKDLQTAYQVGKGMLVAVAEEVQTDPVAAAPTEDEVTEIALSETDTAIGTVDEADPADTPLPEPETRSAPMPQRRMRFAVPQT